MAATPDAAWTLVEDGYDRLRETSLESRFTISNGFLGVRGAQAITLDARPITAPCTYVAGLFDAPVEEGSVAGRIPADDWLRIALRLDRAALSSLPDDPARRRVTLDMRRGAVLGESLRMEGDGLHASLKTLRLVSLDQRGLGLQVLSLEIDQGEGMVVLEAFLEGEALELSLERFEPDLGVWRVRGSGKGLAIAVSTELQVDGHTLAAADGGPFKWSWTWPARAGQVVWFRRLVAFARSDPPGADPGDEARAALGEAMRLGWRGVAAAHEAAWDERWRRSGVEVDGDPAAEQALRFALYHLNGAPNPHDEHISIGARALTGVDYRGHVFWDTEIFLLPFYTLTWPEAARALLMYRFHTLDAARAKAASMGYTGALYAWESADTGTDVTPQQVVGPDRKVVDVLAGREEQHISADIAYAVWQYWQASADDDFLLDAGAEILLETSRFWAGRAALEADGHRHIRRVIGPDEYHETIDDNAFTNVMAQWNIRRALETATLLRERWPDRWLSLSGRLDLTEAELAQWRSAADAMITGLNPDTGLYEQFEGYFGLEDIDLTAYAGRSVPIDVVLGRVRTQGSQIVKQADVVALLALLPEAFAGDSGAANFHYYEPRCGQGSSLSPGMHGLAAARLGECETALRYFRQTAAIDLADTHVAIAGGVHIGALGAVWQMAVLGFGGVSLLSDGLAIVPRLPAQWSRLAFPLQWRGRRLRIEIDGQAIRATLTDGAAMTVQVAGQTHELSRERPLHVPSAG